MWIRRFGANPGRPLSRALVSPQTGFYPLCKCDAIASLAFPDKDDTPAKSPQIPGIAGIARDVLPKLLGPEA